MDKSTVIRRERKDMDYKTRKARIFLGTMLFFSLFSLVLRADKLTDRVDKLFSRWDRKDSPGCALGIIRDGEFVYRRGYGMADLEYDIPITSRSVFRIGSTSKQFTAMCIALLEEEGKLSPEDDIRKHLPEMPWYGKPVTIRHLLHHTSGIRDYLMLATLRGDRDDDYYVDGEVLTLIARQKALNFSPGEEFLYSNSGYFLLGQIVERACGKSMRDYARENIFQPLGMSATHFHDDHAEIVKNRASGYMPDKEGGFRISMTTLDMIGDGGIFTSVDDLLLWDRNFYNNRLGLRSPELLQLLQTPDRLNGGKTLTYAWGLGVDTYRGLKIVAHGGSFVGFRAEMIRFPEQRFSVIVLANLGTINPSSLARRVADIYLDDVMTRDPGAEKPAAPKFTALSEEKIMRFSGTYVDAEKENAVRISPAGKGLAVDRGDNPLVVLPVDDERFVGKTPPHRLSLRFAEKDGTMHLTVAGAGSLSGTFSRIPDYKPAERELSGYSGRYYSEELDVSYAILVEKGGLHLKHENPFKNSPEQGFLPVEKDWFMLPWMHIKFLRDGEEAVTAFSISAGRVKNLRFDRIE
jgi:CubicO group peptidase (beta-lactamase class C family)